ncbi:MAG: hypothetical protein JWM58_180 [Rhizobium sp.]|nr:hypothetical protein [Rhizobium sp.]
MRLFKRIAMLILAIYLLPGLAAAGLWATTTHPKSYREANWTSSQMLPDAATDRDARIVIFAANTGGFKGAFAVHSWIVLKQAGARGYDRYDVMGWGMPVRRNGFPPDGNWYSNQPHVVWQLTGKDAEALIPKIEAAIDNYPHNVRGSYRLWPGPNSNTFVASILRAVPEIDAVLPSNAVGRDYLANGRFYSYDPNGDVHVTLFGLVGFSAGVKSGFEMHILGLVAGLDFRHPGVKVPALGRFGV